MTTPYMEKRYEALYGFIVSAGGVGVTAAEAAKYLEVDKSFAVRMLAELERRGWLQKWQAVEEKRAPFRYVVPAEARS